MRFDTQETCLQALCLTECDHLPRTSRLWRVYMSRASLPCVAAVNQIRVWADDDIGGDVARWQWTMLSPLPNFHKSFLVYDERVVFSPLSHVVFALSAVQLIEGSDGSWIQLHLRHCISELQVMQRQTALLVCTILICSRLSRALVALGNVCKIVQLIFRLARLLLPEPDHVNSSPGLSCHAFGLLRPFDDTEKTFYRLQPGVVLALLRMSIDVYGCWVHFWLGFTKRHTILSLPQTRTDSFFIIALSSLQGQNSARC